MFFLLYGKTNSTKAKAGIVASLNDTTLTKVDCEQSLFCSKIRRENERDGMRDIRAASGEAASRE